MSSQGSIRLKVTNGAPAIEKLWNGRFKLEFFCDNNSPREDWHYENVSALLPEYGILQATNFGSGVSEDWEAIPGSVYPDMRLVLAEYPYNVRAGKHYVKLTYETLTAAWVEEKSEDTDYELNGLKRVSRTFVALPATAYTNVIGTSTITSGGTTLYLGGFNIEETDAKWELTEVWFEAGELSRDIRAIGQGVQQTTHQFLVTEGTTVGDVIGRDTDDFEGLKRITVSVIAKSDGTSLTGAAGAEKLNYSYQQLTPFTFPGVVDLQNEAGHVFPAVRSPVEARVEADVYTYYQTSSDIVAGDYIKESALGLWNPSEWCQKISTISASLDKPAYFNAQGLRGCRTRSAFKLSGDLFGALNSNLQYSTVGNQIQLNNLELEETTEVSNGKSVYRETFRYIHNATRRYDILTGGVRVIQTVSTLSSGIYEIELKWNGSQWVLSGTNSIVDPQPSETGVANGRYVYSEALGGYLDVYTNSTSTNTYTLFTSTNGALEPKDADWPAGVLAETSDNSEEFTAISSVGATVGTNNFAENFSFIEGRVVQAGAVGNIRISGGPPNPLGKKYTLDVNVDKAFTKLDGTHVYRKTIVIATCTPA
jgi:hypothetical protein